MKKKQRARLKRMNFLMLSICIAVFIILPLMIGAQKQPESIENEAETCQIVDSAPISISSSEVQEPLAPNEDEMIEQSLIEQGYYRDDIPLTYEEQDCLQTACTEFNVDYALALGMIEQETQFQNIMGDNGDSFGYMQIQIKWHQDRMNLLGAPDLMNPYDNFRVGCDFIKECIDKYGLEKGLAYYNSGKTKINSYVGIVLENMKKWQKVLDN